MIAADDEVDARIVKRTEVATGIVSLELAAADGGALPPFEPGAHVDVHVAPGVIRQYSLCNDPAETHRYRLGILLEPSSRGGSSEIHRAFEVDRIVRIGRPRCNFRLAPGQKHSILVAGGIGITPLLSMAYGLHAQAADFVLHYCSRSRERTAFASELEASPFASRVTFHHDDGPPEQRFDLDTSLPAPEPDTHVYICGPTGFITFVTDGVKQRGWQADRIHVEHFTADVSKEGSAFTVVAAQSGVTLDVGPDQSIAQALLAHGIEVPLSCEQGVCGTCLTRVLEGTPDHRDLYQTDEEKASNAYITPCCSRAQGERIVLDI